MWVWDLVRGKTAREDRERVKEWDRRTSERADFYKGYGNPTLAELVGADNICQTCYAATPDMPKHLAWHEQMLSREDMATAIERTITHD